MVRIDDPGSVTKCWLTPEELDLLERTAGEWDWQREIAVQLMGRCGLRVDEVSHPGDEDFRWSEDGNVWLFAVRGKNTKGVKKDTRRIDAGPRR